MELLHIVSELVNSAVRHGRRRGQKMWTVVPPAEKSKRSRDMEPLACVERLHGS